MLRPWFRSATTDGDGSYCVNDWRVWCREDGLGFEGARPGIDAYRIRPIAAYTGSVAVVWNDPGPVSVQARSWGAVKSLYRQ